MYEGYLTSILLAWVNARCVSFALDRLWGRTAPEPGLMAGLLNITAFSFYLPLGVMGPLVTSKAGAALPGILLDASNTAFFFMPYQVLLTSV